MSVLISTRTKSSYKAQRDNVVPGDLTVGFSFPLRCVAVPINLRARAGAVSSPNWALGGKRSRN